MRQRFHEDLAALEAEVEELGGIVERQIGDAVAALARRDAGLATAVIARDDEVDGAYLDIERRILDLIALQTPVASDLRLLSAILHINLHLERVGDGAVNIAKIATITQELPHDPTILEHLQEMSDIVRGMLRTSLEAFTRRDLELCLKLPALDDPVDVLNRGMYRKVLNLAGDPAALEWGIRMNTVARQLERVGDHAVDVGEQVGFLLTGEFREFVDSSHKEPLTDGS